MAIIYIKQFLHTREVKVEEDKARQLPISLLYRMILGVMVVEPAQPEVWDVFTLILSLSKTTTEWQIWTLTIFDLCLIEYWSGLSKFLWMWEWSLALWDSHLTPPHLKYLGLLLWSLIKINTSSELLCSRNWSLKIIWTKVIKKMPI